MFKTIKGDILINEKTFIRQLLDILNTSNLEGWNARFIVYEINNKVVITTKRQIKIPFDSIILHGLILNGRFSYLIKPRKELLLLLPFILLLFTVLLVSLFSIFQTINAVIPLILSFFILYKSYRNLSDNYKRDIDTLHHAISKIHETDYLPLKK